MPAAAAAVGAALSSAVASFSLTNFLISTAISMALNAVQGALFGKKPKSSGDSGLSGITEVVRGSVEPHRIIYGQIRVGGTLVYAQTSGAKNSVLHLVVIVAGHEVAEIGDVWLDDVLLGAQNGSGMVTSGRFNGKVWVFRHLGAPDQIADANLIAESTAWSSAHRLRGRAYVHLKLVWDQNTFPTGIPTPKFLVKGKKVYDPRTATTAWSDNWALCIRDYIASPYGVGADADEIDSASLTAAANLCDESVAIHGGTQKRYTMNGSFMADEAPLSVLDKMMTGAAGALVYTRGAYTLFPAAWRTPEITLTGDDFIGDFRVSPSIPRAELFNRVRGTFINPGNYWQAGDFPAVENALYEAQDGERITRDIEMPFTNDATAAQRIARIHLEKTRQGVTVEALASFRALPLAVMDTVRVTLPPLGWEGKAFLVLSWTLDLERGGVFLKLQEDAPEVYSWNFGMALTYDPAPNTSLPDPFTVGAPLSLSILSEAVATETGDNTYKLYVQWAESDDGLVLSGGRIEMQYRRSSDSDWRPSVFIPGDKTLAEIPQVQRNVLYDVRLRSVNALGVTSGWSALTGFSFDTPGAGVSDTLDYGEFSQSVTEILDYGEFSSAPTILIGYGEFV